MGNLEFIFKDKQYNVKVEVIDEGKIIIDYIVYGKNNSKFLFQQQYHIWRFVDGELNKELETIILDALIHKYESNLLCLAYHGDKREIITVSDLSHTGQKFAYSFMCNNSDMGSLYYCENQGWVNNLTLKFSAQWFTAADFNIVIEMLENNQIPWVKPFNKKAPSHSELRRG
ncbi:hypothetical protein [Sphingobacterium sp. 18053]|uniref:hypothetical protein n=1 Tax=Sphingobacterium sp. 18053 TaxID=2681401 RepID=UPI00135A01D8|nr:hypothetical protein [Sphingobacterium sp. 18053]